MKKGRRNYKEILEYNMKKRTAPSPYVLHATPGLRERVSSGCSQWSV
jgi:hypothetical protein